VLRIPNVAQGQINLDNLKYATEDELHEKGSVAPSDFLIVRTNGSQDLIGRGSLVTERYDQPHYFASYLIRLRLVPYKGVESFVAWLWQSLYVRDLLEQEAVSSAGQYNISLSKLSQFVLPMPPLAEQQEIVLRVEQLFKFADAIERRMAAAMVRAEKLIQSVLAKAFRGELVPTEAELARAEGRDYEPASVLLQRIRLEREQPAGDKPGAKNGRSGRRRMRAGKAGIPEPVLDL
jgi:type I restriction enzyme S subunit